ncbi:MAG: GreA/GreB family elongation factor [Microgenomates group bacterium]
MAERTNRMTKSTKAALEREVVEAEGKKDKSLLDIGEAAGTGSDWHDNAAFDNANIRHDVDSITLRDLRQKLHDIIIIEPETRTDMVRIGNTVSVKFKSEPEAEEFTILGPSDSGRNEGWISYESPLAEALLGKKQGDEFPFQTREFRDMIKVLKILAGQF